MLSSGKSSQAIQRVVRVCALWWLVSQTRSWVLSRTQDVPLQRDLVPYGLVNVFPFFVLVCRRRGVGVLSVTTAHALRCQERKTAANVVELDNDQYYW